MQLFLRVIFKTFLLRGLHRTLCEIVLLSLCSYASLEDMKVGKLDGQPPVFLSHIVVVLHLAFMYMQQILFFITF